jgi:hypothetical protein
MNYRLLLSSLGVLSLAGALQAGSWSDMPQPLIVGAPGRRAALEAGASSNLVMDGEWRALWFVGDNSLKVCHWNGRYFQTTALPSSHPVAPGSALVLDRKFHQVFYVGQNGRLCVTTRSNGRWGTRMTLDEPVTSVLGVDQVWHGVYVYSEERQSILIFTWSSRLKRWSSRVVLANVGVAPYEGAVDSVNHILYTTHQTAPALGVNAAENPFVQPWPLIATWWDGTTPRSQVVEQTGLPQRPALRTQDARLCFNLSTDDGRVHWVEPVSRPGATLELEEGISEHGGPIGLPWEDDKTYPVNLGSIDYFGGGGSTGHNSVITMVDRSYSWWDTGWLADGYRPKPPFKAVHCGSRSSLRQSGAPDPARPSRWGATA